MPDQSEDEALRHVIRRATRIGLWVWPSFALLDAYMCFVAYPGGPFAWFVLGRLVVEAALLGVYRASWRPEVPARTLGLAQNGSFALAALCIALMAIPLGGLRSPYMHGISIVLLVRAAVMPESWRRALTIFTAIGLTFPAVMLGWFLADAGGRTAALEGNTLLAFGANFVFVIASAVVGLVSGHTTWAARQQLFRTRRLGRYRLRMPIGRGGMGEVWLAWDQRLRRDIALKLLRPTQAPDSDAFRRFEREAQTASQLRIPHSVQIYDFGVSDDGVHYIAMEYLCGIDLDRLVTRHGPLAAGRAMHFAKQACRSLEEAHAAGIIHRDVKPSNLFVTQVGDDPDFIKLLDFGLARLRPTAARDDRVTATGMLCGTPAYLAPEIWDGSEADERGDIYALGVSLYFLLTGRVPYQADSPVGVRGMQLTSEAQPPSALRGEPLPAGLDLVVLRAIAKDPADRYPSALELRRALDTVPASWTTGEAEACWTEADGRTGGRMHGGRPVVRSQPERSEGDIT
ncbi:MAG TPA: serine/threonine-protein kinase [Gemmatimonadales bacterium]